MVPSFHGDMSPLPVRATLSDPLIATIVQSALHIHEILRLLTFFTLVL